MQNRQAPAGFARDMFGSSVSPVQALQFRLWQVSPDKSLSQHNDQEQRGVHGNVTGGFARTEAP